MIFSEAVSSIKALDVRGMGWDDNDAHTFAQALPCYSSLESLVLEGNRIGDTGSQALLKALEKCNALESLNLRHNALSEDCKEKFKKVWGRHLSKTAHKLRL